MKHNERTKCSHRNINDELEIARKANKLADILLEGSRLTRNNTSLTWKDIVPDEPVDCLDGYRTDTETPEKVWNKYDFEI